MSTATRTRLHRRCPECGKGVKRILRTANDKRRWDAERWRRFRCRSCDWQGLLAVAPPRPRAAVRPRGKTGTLVAAGRVLLVLLAGAGLSLVGLQVLQMLLNG